MPPKSACRALAPGSIGNLACGFDVLGLALEGPADVVEARWAPEPGVRIREIHGDRGRLPRDPALNSAGAAASALLALTGERKGVELELWKGLPLSAGMGGSAASAVAAVRALDALIGSRLPPETLLACALEGERVAAGAAHPDNAAPSLLGGMVLTPAWVPLRAIPLEVPAELWAVLVHPHTEVRTEEARNRLGAQVQLTDAVVQWGNTAALVAGLFRSDWELIARAVEDRIAEPVRAPLVPAFEQVRKAALEAGALAASLSGSGPSMFALTRGPHRARAVAEAMAGAFHRHAGLGTDTVVSPGRAPGARILEPGEPLPTSLST